MSTPHGLYRSGEAGGVENSGVNLPVRTRASLCNPRFPRCACPPGERGRLMGEVERMRVPGMSVSLGGRLTVFKPRLCHRGLGRLAVTSLCLTLLPFQTEKGRLLARRLVARTT